VLKTFVSLAVGLDDDIKRIARRADDVNVSYDSVQAWVSRGMMPPIDDISNFINGIHEVFADMISITKDVYIELVNDSDSIEKIEKVFKNSMNFVNKIESDLIDSVERNNVNGVKAKSVELYRVFYTFVYSSLQAVNRYISRVSRMKFAEEIFRRLGMIPEQETVRKALPKIGGGNV